MARPKSDIEPRIVHAASVRFVELGVEGASLRRIAEDAGTSIGMIYYYFPTKDDLFLAVVEEVYAVLLSDLGVALLPNVPIEERLLRLYTRLGQVSVRELSVVRLIAREALGSSARFGRLLERFKRGHIPLILATIQDGIAGGALRKDLPLLATLLGTVALGTLPQFIRTAASRHLPHSTVDGTENFPNALVDILLNGIAQPRA